jgi:ubiquinone/menaquinone biosynthesis C-methylase UbiE
MSEATYNLSQGYGSLAAEMLYAYMDGCPADELAFYERHIRSNGGTAIDQACGTGRHLFPLLERGLDIHGADASADALRLARRKAEESQLRPQLHHQRMEDFEVPNKYGTIYIPNGSFHLINDRQQALNTLERFWRHLNPGGQILIDMVIPAEVMEFCRTRNAENPQRWGPAPRKYVEGEISTTLWTESFDLLEQTVVEKRRYELHVDGQLAQSELHTLHMRWYHKYEFIMMLQQNGFEEIFLYGDYTEDPATKDSKTIICGARRPRKST